MSQPFDLIRLLDGLKRQYGELKHSKKWNSPYYRVDVADRLEFLKVLVQTIKDSGKGEEYFNGSIRKDIVEELIPYERSIEKSVRELCKLSVQKDLRMAIAEVYATEEEAPKSLRPVREKPFAAEFDPSSAKDDSQEIKDVIDPDMDKLLGFDDE